MLHPIRRALISVSDKSGLEPLVRCLHEYGVEILSTGGTAKLIEGLGIQTKEVSTHTGFPEMMDGRVKTLHPTIHGGLLAIRTNPAHAKAMADHHIPPIDLVVVNLYPFEETVSKGADAETIIENIDIGGPSMIRSAAKNHPFVAVLTASIDYASLIDELHANQGKTSLELRQKLAAKAFARTASYDAAIAAWCQNQWLADTTPSRLTISAELVQPLRYGENPHQSAAFYRTNAAIPCLANATQHQGKELSYNNINDTDAAWLLVSEFSQPAAVIVKHASPCGAATSSSLHDAYQKALACDPLSAFGGIIALNRTLDAATATEIASLFAEVIIAPAADADALEILSAKKDTRILTTGGLPSTAQLGQTAKTVLGGLLLQSQDNATLNRANMQQMSGTPLDDATWHEALFAMMVVKHVKSNAIVITQNHATIGIGGGQTSRVDAVEQAIQRAKTRANQANLNHAVLASDAFFPFADSIEKIAASGIRTIIQPGGSKRDDEVIQAANHHGINMVFTGQRHFRH